MSHIGPSSSTSHSPTTTTATMTKTSTDSTKGGKRTRSVSTLTPSQLARKRANDREAQRAIRARTKEHIENLEREIEQLRARHSRDETVQDLLRRNKALEDELHRLRDGVGIRSSGPSAPYHSPFNSSSRTSPFGQSTPDYSVVSDISPYSNRPETTDAWPSSVPYSVPSTVSSPSSSGAPDDFGSNYFPTSAPSAVMDRNSLTPATTNSPTASCISGDVGFDDVKHAASRIWMPTTAQHRAPHANLSSTAMEHVPRVLPSFPGSDLRRHGSFQAAPSLNTRPSCQTDSLLAGYVSDCQRLVAMAGGRPHHEVIFGPTRPNVRLLLQAHTDLASTFGLVSTPPHTLASHPLVELATTLFDSDGLVLPLERIGTFLLLQTFLAWLIQPTHDTYTALGVLLSPRPSQRAVSHGHWIDLILWPQLRDIVTENQELYGTEEFRRLYRTSLRVQHRPTGLWGAVSINHPTGAIHINDDFMKHVGHLENWGLHFDFFRRYPELGSLAQHVG
ncbi:hypothetical protein F4780DRAFT_457583 [Xylariomycetidae sp. FL0641]|nr:hypothetical protein F4780DRAFT_457583 [Xylariomycetidae sp. FL0641]